MRCRPCPIPPAHGLSLIAGRCDCPFCGGFARPFGGGGAANCCQGRDRCRQRGTPPASRCACASRSRRSCSLRLRPTSLYLRAPGTARVLSSGGWATGRQQVRLEREARSNAHRDIRSAHGTRLSGPQQSSIPSFALLQCARRGATAARRTLYLFAASTRRSE